MGILGKVLATTSDTQVYTVPNAKRTVCLINATNTSGAEAKITLSIRKETDYKLGSIALTNAGNNYAVKPDILIEDATGDQAVTATAEVSTLEISQVTLVSTGLGYSINDILTLNAASNTQVGDVELQIRVTGVGASGEVNTWTIEEAGTCADVIGDEDLEFTGGTGGTSPVIDGSALLYSIKSVTITAPGSDYLVTPTVTVVDPLDGTTPLGNAILTAAMISDGVSKYDAFEYNVTLVVSGTLERTAIVLGEGDTIFAKSDTSDAVNVMVFGVEDLA